MVLISLIHAASPVQDHLRKLRPVSGNRKGNILFPADNCIPASMGLHVGLIDHVKTIFITETVELRAVRIVTGTDSVDVVLLHGDQILTDDIFRDHPAGFGAEFVTVHSFKNDPLSVQEHDTVFDLKPSETNLFFYGFAQCPGFVVHQDSQVIQFRLLSTPEFRPKDRHLQLVPHRILSAEGIRLFFLSEEERIRTAADLSVTIRQDRLDRGHFPKSSNPGRVFFL